MIERTQIKCNKCRYEWKTKSKLKHVSCPNCLHKVERFEYEGLDDLPSGTKVGFKVKEEED